MSSEEPLYSILDFILNRANSAELEAVAEALKRRQKPGKGLGGISPRSMAENVAGKIKEQLGDMLDVHSISRRIVTDLIKQKEPNIGDAELEVLLDNWLPGSALRNTAERPPVPPGAEQKQAGAAPDVLITRISRYVAARQGSLSHEETASLPKNWQSQYWEAFPKNVRAHIRDYLNGRLDEVDFWNSVISSLGQ